MFTQVLVLMISEFFSNFQLMAFLLTVHCGLPRRKDVGQRTGAVLDWKLELVLIWDAALQVMA